MAAQRSDQGMMKCDYVQGSLLERAHQLIRRKLSPGDTVVDATTGNGHDTLFLAQCVGDGGRVIGFDVQDEAIRATQEKLLRAGVPGEVFELHLEGHECMQKYVSPGVSCVMFNLGYLPGSDKSRITETPTTLEGLRQALTCLRPGGLLSVMCYPGHAGGDREATAVTGWTSECDDCLASVTCYRRVGVGERSPFLIMAEKCDTPPP